MGSTFEKYVDKFLYREFREVTNSYRVDELPEPNNYDKAVIYKYTDDGFEELNIELREQRSIETWKRY